MSARAWRRDSYSVQPVLPRLPGRGRLGDPINHIKDRRHAHPTHLFKVLNDGVVPNNSTDRLIAAGGLTKLTTPGPNPVGAPARGAWSFFKSGSHGSLFDPTASLPATMEMQAQAISFAASAPLPGGPFVRSA